LIDSTYTEVVTTVLNNDGTRRITCILDETYASPAILLVQRVLAQLCRHEEFTARVYLRTPSGVGR